MNNTIFTTIRTTSINRLFSYDVYKVKPGGIEKKHYHLFFEIVHIIKGKSSTHTQGHWYFYKRGQIHEFINDSHEEMIISVLTMPPETAKGTYFI